RERTRDTGAGEDGPATESGLAEPAELAAAQRVEEAAHLLLVAVGGPADLVEVADDARRPPRDRGDRGEQLEYRVDALDGAAQRDPRDGGRAKYRRHVLDPVEDGRQDVRGQLGEVPDDRRRGLGQRRERVTQVREHRRQRDDRVLERRAERAQGGHQRVDGRTQRGEELLQQLLPLGGAQEVLHLAGQTHEGVEEAGALLVGRLEDRENDRPDVANQLTELLD